MSDPHILHILFICNNPEHSTFKQLISKLQNYSRNIRLTKKKVVFDHIKSSMDLEKIQSLIHKYLKRIKRGGLSELIIMVVPDHQNIYHLLQWLRTLSRERDYHTLFKKEVKVINPIDTTLEFKNRWDIERRLHDYLKEFNSNSNPKFIRETRIKNEEIAPFGVNAVNAVNAVKTPRSFFYRNGLSEFNPSDSDNNDDERDNIEKVKVDATENIRAVRFLMNAQKISFPLIAKYPINHCGIHFVKIIRSEDDLIKISPLLEYPGLIFQEYITNSLDAYISYFKNNYNKEELMQINAFKHNRQSSKDLNKESMTSIIKLNIFGDIIKAQIVFEPLEPIQLSDKFELNGIIKHILSRVKSYNEGINKGHNHLNIKDIEIKDIKKLLLPEISVEYKKDLNILALGLLDLNSFNSSNIHNNSLKEKKIINEVKIPEILRACIKYISHRWDLKIFGMDLVISDDMAIYIIDINDFPGSRKVKGAADLIIKSIIPSDIAKFANKN